MQDQKFIATAKQTISTLEIMIANNFWGSDETNEKKKAELAEWKNELALELAK